LTAPVDWPRPGALPAQATALAAAAAAAAAVVAADVVWAAAVLAADAVTGPWGTGWRVRQHALGWHAAAGSPPVGDPGEQHQLVNPLASFAAAAAAAAVGAVHAAVSAVATGAVEQAVHGAAGNGPGMVTCLTYADHLGVG